MGKWKCGICNSEFDNYQAQGFNEIIYCPLCYFKELYKREKQENEDDLKCINSLKEQLESVINENQRLLKQWFENNDKAVELISEKEYYNQNFKDYKSRCEKAVAKIKDLYSYSDNEEYVDNYCKDLLNILQIRGNEE